MKVSIIIPTLNDSDWLRGQLESLQGYRQSGHEVIVVDGGSDQGGHPLQEGLTDCFVRSGPGRARQMNRGAELASGEVLLFLHVDTRLPAGAIDLLAEALRTPDSEWGRFDVRLSGSARVFRIIERLINLRSHLTGVATGDQGLFVRNQTFRQLGGYPAIPLMEDVALSKRLRRLAWPVRVKQAVTTSSRRWEQHGVLATVLLMWWLRLLYFCGASPRYLARKYYRSSTE